MQPTSIMRRPNGRKLSRRPAPRQNSRSMNFEFTEEQKLFAEAVRKFARAELEAGALERAHNPRFPFDVAQRMSRQGLMGITLPEADGGQGGSLMDAVIAIEQVALVCPRSADVVQSGSFGPIRTFAEYASPALKSKYLADLLAGRTVISLGMSEPDAGSAATDLKTAAKPDGVHYVINGTKVFSTFSPDAEVFLIYARFGPGVGGIGSVIVPRNTPGFRIGQPASCISRIAGFRPTTCCSARAASGSRWPASTSSASAMRRAHSLSGATPSTR